MHLFEQQERHRQLFPKLKRNGFGGGQTAINPKVSEVSDQLWELDFCGFGDRSGDGPLWARSLCSDPTTAGAWDFICPHQIT